MTDPRNIRRWLLTLADHYHSLLVSGVARNALVEIEMLEAERDRLREALEVADRLLTSHAIASGKYWRKPFATRHEMTHGKIRAAIKEQSK